MKKTTLALLLLSATAAFAQTHTPNTAYGAIDVGTWGGPGSPTALSFSGGYNFAPNLSAEAGYAKMADVTTSVTLPFFGTTTTTVSQYALKGAVVYTHPVAPKVNLQGRAGLAYFSAAVTTEGGGFPVSSSSINLTPVDRRHS